MAHDRLALSEIFAEEVPVTLLACRKFLKQPSDDAYPVQRSLRVGDHYDGQKEDLPFRDDKLITTINKFIKAIPLYPPQAFFHLYIPAYDEPSDRTMVVYGHDEEVVTKISGVLREIFSAYRNDDLGTLNIKKLTEVFADKETQKPKKAPNAQIISIADWLNGVDETQPETHHQEEHIGRIKFDASLDVKIFDGERKAGLKRLRQVFADKLHVQMTSTHHDHCLDLTGSKEDVKIAYEAGRKIAPFINEGIKIDAERINKALRDARRDVGIRTVDQLLGADTESRLKQKHRAAAKSEQEQTPWASGIGRFQEELPDPNQNFRFFNPPKM